MIINEYNGLILRKHELIREGKDKEEVDRIDAEIRKKTSEYLDSIQTRKDIVQEKIEEIKDLPSYRQQYKRAIELYRELNELVVLMRQFKKKMREER